MGLIHTKLNLSNPVEKDLDDVSVKALVDTGALHLCIPQHVAMQLNLTQIEEREVTTADGKKHLCPYVGPVQVNFANRSCYTGALVIGNEVLLGAVPMEDMDLVISPEHQTLVVNPDNPNIATSVVKRSLI